MGFLKLAIVGRPNVGKSSLFNRICRKRTSIVAEEEGVTRDRIYTEASYLDKKFIIVDTAGLDFSSKKEFDKKILIQTEVAIEEADSIVQVVDSKTGPLLLDKKISKILLKSKKPIFLAINKVDNYEILSNLDFFGFESLGIQDIFKISCTNKYNIDLLLEEILKSFSKKQFLDKENKKESKIEEGSQENIEDEILEKPLKITIVGRSNVGKSSFLNFVLKKERSVTSDSLATTRDSIEEKIYVGKDPYILIDTAGIRRKKKEKSVVEKFSFIRTKKAILKSDVCFLMIDIKDKITKEDKKIFSFIRKEKRACFLLINKCDLVVKKDKSLKEIEESRIPTFFISSKTGENIKKVFLALKILKNKMNKKIKTPLLNKFIQEALQKYNPPMVLGKRLKIYYLTQSKSFPPSFILFVNNPLFLKEGYKRYLFNKFQDTFDLKGFFITFEIKGKVL